jgi:hypothetical protein
MPGIKYTCKGERMVHEDGDVNYTGCGVDMTQAIEAVPADGNEHVVACPYCGARTTVTKNP